MKCVKRQMGTGVISDLQSGQSISVNSYRIPPDYCRWVSSVDLLVLLLGGSHGLRLLAGLGPYLIAGGLGLGGRGVRVELGARESVHERLGAQLLGDDEFVLVVEGEVDGEDGRVQGVQLHRGLGRQRVRLGVLVDGGVHLDDGVEGCGQQAGSEREGARRREGTGDGGDHHLLETSSLQLLDDDGLHQLLLSSLDDDADGRLQEVGGHLGGIVIVDAESTGGAAGKELHQLSAHSVGARVRAHMVLVVDGDASGEDGRTLRDGHLGAVETAEQLEQHGEHEHGGSQLPDHGYCN
ncbi:hypothetical protein PFISCL1PPCAC_7803, partial [Pristionchus fissidentatus]